MTLCSVQTVSNGTHSECVCDVFIEFDMVMMLILETLVTLVMNLPILRWLSCPWFHGVSFNRGITCIWGLYLRITKPLPWCVVFNSMPISAIGEAQSCFCSVAVPHCMALLKKLYMIRGIAFRMFIEYGRLLTIYRMAVLCILRLSSPIE